MTDHLITEPLRVETCPRCYTVILRGHTSGLNVRLDPYPIDAHQELAALLAGKHTYDIYFESWPTRIYAEWRDSKRISVEREHPVVAQHKCERRQEPPRSRSTENRHTPVPQTDVDEKDDIPPF